MKNNRSKNSHGLSRRSIKRELQRLGRPAGSFDAQRYFRGDQQLRFYNVGTKPMRAYALSLYKAHRNHWSIEDAMRLTDDLITDPYLETKSVGIEIVARFRRGFTPELLSRWKRWLSQNHSGNWATTDAICGLLIGPLLVEYPAIAGRMRVWSRDRNMWVRRASIVGLIPLLRRGIALDVAYEIAQRSTRTQRTSSKRQWVGRFARPARWTRNGSSYICAPQVRPFHAQLCDTRLSAFQS